MARMDCPGVAAIVAVMRRKGHRLFENPGGHDLNLVGIRNNSFTCTLLESEDFDA